MQPGLRITAPLELLKSNSSKEEVRVVHKIKMHDKLNQGFLKGGMCTSRITQGNFTFLFYLRICLNVH